MCIVSVAPVGVTRVERLILFSLKLIKKWLVSSLACWSGAVRRFPMNCARWFLEVISKNKRTSNGKGKGKAAMVVVVVVVVVDGVVVVVVVVEVVLGEEVVVGVVG